MKLSKFAALAGAILLLGAPSAFAEPVNIVLGSGATSGTYYPVVSEIAKFCDSDTIVVTHFMDPSLGEGKETEGGSVANLRRILDNKATGGLVQLDVAYLEKLANPAMSRVLALLPLHAEQVHVIVPASVNVPVLKEEASGGLFGIGAHDAIYEDQLQSNPMTTISELAGKRVAAWGGSVTTAKVVDQQGGIGFAEIVPVKDRDEAFGLLNSGQVAAVLAVTGAPTAWVAALPKGQYKLLVAGKTMEEAVSAVYATSGISYDNMGQTGQQISALSVDSLLMTRTYKTPEMVNALAELQKCVQDNIFLIQDTPGTHPAWQTIDPSREMKWDNLFIAPAQPLAAPAN